MLGPDWLVRFLLSVGQTLNSRMVQWFIMVLTRLDQCISYRSACIAGLLALHQCLIGTRHC